MAVKSAATKERKNMKKTYITKHTRFSRSLLPAVLVATSLLAGSLALADDKGKCDDGSANSLAKWDELFWRWAYGDYNITPDANGNAVVRDLVLMPLPNAPGDGTPASIDVTADAGQSFLLPLFGLLGNSYTDGTPPDPFVDFSVFNTMKLKLTLDGKAVLGIKEALGSYEKFSFTPPIPLINSPPYAAVIWFQGIATFLPDLSPGKHVLRLVEATTQPAFGYLFAYDNTWNITVKNPAHGGGCH